MALGCSEKFHGTIPPPDNVPEYVDRVGWVGLETR